MSATDTTFNTPDGWLSRNAQGELLAGDVSLLALAGEYGTPLYVYSRQAIEATWQRFAQALAGRDARICFAVKANSNLAILGLFAQLGADFDVMSGGKLARVIAAGGDPLSLPLADSLLHGCPPFPSSLPTPQDWSILTTS